MNKSLFVLVLRSSHEQEPPRCLRVGQLLDTASLTSLQGQAGALLISPFCKIDEAQIQPLLSSFQQQLSEGF